MKYEELGPIDRDEAERTLAGQDAEAVSLALLRLALHDPDWRWVQEQCLRFVGHPDVWVRRNAATSLGHLARLHRQLDSSRVIPVLEKLKKDPEVASEAETALDDLTIFLRPRAIHQ